MIDKLRTLLSDSDRTLEERLFLLAGVASTFALLMVALITIGANQGIFVSLALVACMVASVATTIYGWRTGKTTIGGSILVLLAVVVILPIGYFMGGGANSGTPIWFVVIALFIAIVFPGRLMWIYLGLAAVSFAACTVASYLHPELVVPLASPDLIYADTLTSGLVVGAVVALFLRYQGLLYKRETSLVEEQKEQIERLNESQNRFFSSMSHEIRTPLNTIIGLNEMILRDNTVSEEIAENANNIQNASKMLLALINDVLDLSKIESGRMEVVSSQYETSRMLSEIVNLLWMRAREKGLRFDVNVGENIPSMLYGDEMRLKQVIINVLTNAIKYTNEGSVTLTVDGEKSNANEFMLRVDVEDTGIGIRRENIPYLFDSFKRVEEDRTRTVEGTGLGLAISKQLIDLMGGRITVDSIYTKGSHFHIEVPQGIVSDKPMNYTSVSEVQKGQGYENTFEAPEAHVLIVDDNDMNRMVSRKLLRATRVNTDVAASGRECLEKTRQNRYDVIFMDHEMPEMDGIETLQQMRNQPGGLNKTTPVIALTANAGSDMNMFYVNKGFQAYLAKPIHGSLLEATLLQHLPSELVERSVIQQDGETFKVSTVKPRKPIAVTVDCPCDLPPEMLQEHSIRLMPYYIITEEGRFRDVFEIDSDNLFAYLGTGGKAHTTPGTVEEYESFFGEVLGDAETVIHVSVSSKVSSGYETACRAAASFGNVYVVDSHQFSRGLGLVALEAARLAELGEMPSKIVEQVDAYSDRIQTTVMVSSYDSPVIAIGVPAPLRLLMSALNLEPVFRLGRKGMTLDYLHGGYITEGPDKYINRIMRKARRTSGGALYMAMSGFTLQEQEHLAELARKHSHFDELVVLKASATVSANCWMRSMGLMYLK